MSLSKNNLSKLKTFIKENNFININLSQNTQESNDSKNLDDPSKIFYSIVDNTENINETAKENLLLKKSEEIFHNINSIKTNCSKNLSIEDHLYDEFNYLLDD